jgi:hypothetical protein
MSYAPVGSGGGGGAWEFISTATISAQATVDITLSGTHKMFVLHIDNLIPVNDNTEELQMQFSVDAGVSYLAGASDYAWSFRGIATASLSGQSGADTSIPITRNVSDFMGTTAGESVNGFVYIHNANQTTNAIIATTDIIFQSAVPNTVVMQTRAGLVANIDEVDAVRFKASAGNLTSGRISLYGVNDA